MNGLPFLQNIRRAWPPTTAHAGRIAFLIAVALAACTIWLAPHPPMVDLPQHAGQLALLKQMLSGDTRWSSLFQINWFTPYFIGFGLALPLTFLMSIAAAMKLMLTLAFLAFVFMCVRLRRHFGADPRMDWLFLCPFFGFAFHWGFFTFLIASPLGLLVLWLSDRHAQAPSPRRGAGIAALGLLLLVSHGLVFLFTLAVAAALLLVRIADTQDRTKKLLMRAWHSGWPLLVMAGGCFAYFLARGPAEAAFQVAPTVPAVMWHLGLRHEVLSYVFRAQATPAYSVVAAAMLLAPWLMELRPAWNRSWSNRAACLPFAVVAAFLCFVPSFMLETSFVFERFALFLLPSYAWMFRAAPPGRLHAAAVALALTTCVMLGLHGWRVWQFGKESADFDRLMAHAEPGQRAMALMFNRRSEVMADKRTYLHHVLWYQVERQGLVDFNFAWVPPQIVRYRVAARPPMAMRLASYPQEFQWQRHGADSYRYFFVRQDPGSLTPLFSDAPCAPRLLHRENSWQLYERVVCPAADR